MKLRHGCYLFDGNAYNEPEELQSALQVKKQWLFDQVYEDLHDMITVLCPITNKNEPIWESGAKNFILAYEIFSRSRPFIESVIAIETGA